MRSFKSLSTSLLFVSLLTWSVFSAEFGNTDETYTLYSATTSRRAHQFTMPANGTITAVSVYHKTQSSGQLQLGVYSNSSSNLPSNKLGGTAKTNIAATTNWQTISLDTPVTVSAGTKIWLAFMYQTNSTIQRYGSVTGSGYVTASGATWSNTANNMPATFGTTSSSTGAAYSIKAIYTPAGSNYTLTVTASNGTVAKSPDLPSYPSGQTVTLTATPASCYLFSSWSGDASGSTNPLTITMNANKNITANFAADPQCSPTTDYWPSGVTGPGQNMKLQGNFGITNGSIDIYNGDFNVWGDQRILLNRSAGQSAYFVQLNADKIRAGYSYTGFFNGMEYSSGLLSVYRTDTQKKTCISAGDIITNGKITTTELVVTATPVFPDYVFGKDYKLPSLKETKQYIQKNGKLPGMVSAADVQKNGLSVGAMQTKLLEKIEEMTLHMIQMQEKMDKMQKHIDELEAANKK